MEKTVRERFNSDYRFGSSETESVRAIASILCVCESTSCVCLPLYNVSLIVLLNCKSLWIKSSAKLINVNVLCA